MLAESTAIGREWIDTVGDQYDGVRTDASRHRYLACKFAGEWLLALVLLVVTAPLVAGLALAVRATSSGPAFYLQTRLGRGGRKFRIVKLRTMRHNCEQGTGAVWSQPGDVRVTALGRLLRDTHMDELPQLWNVLRAEMALVGPRPERPSIAAELERALPAYRHRLLVRPGVTGLAQVRLPPDSDLEGVRKKLAHDLYYVRELSFNVDLRIAVGTAFYFLGSASNAICQNLVKAQGRAVEIAS